MHGQDLASAVLYVQCWLDSGEAHPLRSGGEVNQVVRIHRPGKKGARSLAGESFSAASLPYPPQELC